MAKDLFTIRAGDACCIKAHPMDESGAGSSGRQLVPANPTTRIARKLSLFVSPDVSHLLRHANATRVADDIGDPDNRPSGLWLVVSQFVRWASPWPGGWRQPNRGLGRVPSRRALQHQRTILPLSYVLAPMRRRRGFPLCRTIRFARLSSDAHAGGDRVVEFPSVCYLQSRWRNPPTRR